MMERNKTVFGLSSEHSSLTIILTHSASIAIPNGQTSRLKKKESGQTSVSEQGRTNK
jgi:hypothetical protein